MRTKNEIQELKQELEAFTCFIADFGTEQEFADKCVSYSCDIIDAINWIQEEIGTERFRSDAYLDINKLHAIASKIEQRTGKKLSEDVSKPVSLSQLDDIFASIKRSLTEAGYLK